MTVPRGMIRGLSKVTVFEPDERLDDTLLPVFKLTVGLAALASWHDVRLEAVALLPVATVIGRLESLISSLDVTVSSLMFATVWS